MDVKGVVIQTPVVFAVRSGRAFERLTPEARRLTRTGGVLAGCRSRTVQQDQPPGGKVRVPQSPR